MCAPEQSNFGCVGIVIKDPNQLSRRHLAVSDRLRLWNAPKWSVVPLQALSRLL